MQALFNVVVPVFLVIGAGYVAVWTRLLGDRTMDELMRFTTHFAIPCLLFVGVSTLDLGQSFGVALLGSFYLGATICFAAGVLGARFLFARPWEDSVVIGFCCLFSNALMLGLTITERAYGAGVLGFSIAIVAIHTPYCYLLGITTMEIVRNRGGNAFEIARRVVVAMFSNALMIAIGLGFFVNLAGVPVPAVLSEALSFVVPAALPVALFALGGVLCRYRPEGDLRVIAFVCGLSLLVHPALVWSFGTFAGLSEAQFRAAVLMAAMSPGVNGYVFATLYGRAMRVAASSVLLGTALSVLTAWAWLQLLP